MLNSLVNFSICSPLVDTLSLVYLFSTRVYLSFKVHKLEKFSSNTGKVHFEGLIHILRYIRYNKTLALNYYDNINDARVSELLSRDSINTENKLMYIYDSSWQDYPETGISTGA